ncbi:MAG: hypothetical protein LH631_07400 [Alkalinema sp. CAN_BIN05]|nr:hypothetical protein [Alkalinema sp. CAN_BIN05]
MMESTPLTNPWRSYLNQAAPTGSSVTKWSSFSDWTSADPITPLRDRDVLELMGWFAREDMPDVEEDINKTLVYLFPEPCWDEDWAFILAIG